MRWGWKVPCFFAITFCIKFKLMLVILAASGYTTRIKCPKSLLLNVTILAGESVLSFASNGALLVMKTSNSFFCSRIYKVIASIVGYEWTTYKINRGQPENSSHTAEMIRREKMSMSLYCLKLALGRYWFMSERRSCAPTKQYPASSPQSCHRHNHN